MSLGCPLTVYFIRSASPSPILGIATKRTGCRAGLWVCSETLCQSYMPTGVARSFCPLAIAPGFLFSSYRFLSSRSKLQCPWLTSANGVYFRQVIVRLGHSWPLNSWSTSSRLASIPELHGSSIIARGIAALAAVCQAQNRTSQFTTRESDEFAKEG